jgi:thioredoxin 1
VATAVAVSATATTFAAEVLEADRPVLAEFRTSWCSHCRQMQEHLQKLAAEHAGAVKVVTIDIEAEADLAARYGVHNVPSTFVFLDGELAGEVRGARAKSELAPLFRALVAPEASTDLKDVLRALRPATEGDSCEIRAAAGEGATCSSGDA